jgi:hypothetical protein
MFGPIMIGRMLLLNIQVPLWVIHDPLCFSIGIVILMPLVKWIYKISSFLTLAVIEDFLSRFVKNSQNISLILIVEGIIELFLYHD